MSTKVNLEMFHRETFIVYAQMIDTDGDPIDLTASNNYIRWGVSSASNTTPALVLTSNGAGIAPDTDAANGDIVITIAANAQANIYPNTAYVHECRIDLADGTSMVQFDGNIIFKRSMFTPANVA